MKSLNIEIISIFIIFICCLNGHALGVTLEDIGLSSAKEAQFVKDTEQAVKAAQIILGYDRASDKLGRNEDPTNFDIVRHAIDFDNQVSMYIKVLGILINKDTTLANLTTNLLNLLSQKNTMYKDAQDAYLQTYGKQDSDLKAEKNVIDQQNKIITDYENKYSNLYTKLSCDSKSCKLKL